MKKVVLENLLLQNRLHVNSLVYFCLFLSVLLYLAQHKAFIFIFNTFLTLAKEHGSPQSSPWQHEKHDIHALASAKINKKYYQLKISWQLPNYQ